MCPDCSSTRLTHTPQTLHTLLLISTTTRIPLTIMSLVGFFSDPFYDEFDRLFDEAFSRRTGGNGNTQVARQGSNAPRVFRPTYVHSPPQPSIVDITHELANRIDLHEDKEKNLVTATFELPGLKKEDVNIDVHNNVLTVSGESKQSEEHNDNGFVVKERRYGKFSRSIPVPQGIKVRFTPLLS